MRPRSLAAFVEFSSCVMLSAASPNSSSSRSSTSERRKLNRNWKLTSTNLHDGSDFTSMLCTWRRTWISWIWPPHRKSYRIRTVIILQWQSKKQNDSKGKGRRGNHNQGSGKLSSWKSKLKSGLKPTHGSLYSLSTLKPEEKAPPPAETRFLTNALQSS